MYQTMNIPSDTEILNLRELFHQIHDDLNISSAVIDSKNFNVSTVPGGSSNVNYRVNILGDHQKDYFVKFQSIPPLSHFYADNLLREYKISKYLSKFNLAPKPIFLDKTKKYLVTEFVDGKNPDIKDREITQVLIGMGNALKAFRNAPVQLLKQLNTGTRLCPKKFFFEVILPTVHSLKTDILKEGSISLFQFLEEITAYLQEQIKFEPNSDCSIDWDKFQKNPKQFPWGLIHNDLSLKNIIYTTSGRTIFVDWEFADFGDIAYDLAYLMSENLLSEPQIKSILEYGKFDASIRERTYRYIRIFLPMIELANAAFWTLNHIRTVVQSQDQKIPLRPPHSISQNLEYVKWKISRLIRVAKLSPTDQDQVYQEIFQALKLFEINLILSK